MTPPVSIIADRITLVERRCTETVTRPYGPSLCAPVIFSDSRLLQDTLTRQGMMKITPHGGLRKAESRPDTTIKISPRGLKHETGPLRRSRLPLWRLRMGMGVSVVAHQWEEVVLHDRDNERADQLTDSHAPDLGLQGKLTNHLVIERQASSFVPDLCIPFEWQDGCCLIVIFLWYAAGPCTSTCPSATGLAPEAD